MNMMWRYILHLLTMDDPLQLYTAVANSIIDMSPSDRGVGRKISPWGSVFFQNWTQVMVVAK
jgi:hypothetical protein